MDIIGYLTIYVSLILGFSAYIAKTSSKEDFFIGGRSRNSLTILFSKFSGAIGVSTFITYTAYAYKYGWGLFAMSLGTVIGYLIFAYWAAPRIKTLSDIGNFYTQGDLVKYVTNNSTTSKITNITTICVQFFWVLLSLAGGAKIIAYFDILSYEISLLITATVVMIYVLLSGYKAVMLTDIFQGIIIILLLCLLIYYLLSGIKFSTVLTVSTNDQIKFGSIFGLVLYGGLSVFGLADRYQLCYAAKDTKSLKKGLGLAILPILVIAFLLLLIGLSVFFKKPNLDPDLAFIYAMKNLVSPSLIPILLILFFAGLMSTADTSVFAVASHTNALVNERYNVKIIRIITIITIITATIISWFWKSIVDITIIGAALRMTLSIPMIYIIKQKNNSLRYMSSVTGGILGLLLGILIFGPKPTIAILVLIGSLIGLIFKSKN